MKNKKAKIEKKLKRGYLPYIDYVIYNKRKGDTAYAGGRKC